jgi:hypothetical protein
MSKCMRLLKTDELCLRLYPVSVSLLQSPTVSGTPSRTPKYVRDWSTFVRLARPSSPPTATVISLASVISPLSRYPHD